MRIPSLTIWVLYSAALAEAAAAAAQNVSFTPSDFSKGFDSTAVMIYQNLLTESGGNGHMFEWTPNQKSGGPAVKSLVLATVNKTPIFTMESNQTLDGISVDWTGGSLTLHKQFFESNLTRYKNSSAVFFQIEWVYEQERAIPKRDTDSTYSYSPPWAVADNEDTAQKMLTLNSALSTPSMAYQESGPSPAVSPATESASPATDPTSTSSSSPRSSSGAATTSTTSSHSASKSHDLSAGAIAGIVVGAVILLALISFGAACLVLRNRRRKRHGADGDHHSRDVRTIQDLMAEKEARAIVETAPDTPYSERDSGRAMQLQRLQLQHHSSLSLNRLSDREMDMGAAGDVGSASNRASGIGTAVTTMGSVAGRSPTHHHHDDRDNDSVYNTELEHSSMMRSPTHRLSPSHQQQDRSFSPYTDRSPTDYSQHHRIVDGADLVQQEQSNSNTSKLANGSSPVIVAGSAERQQHLSLPRSLSPPSRSSSSSSVYPDDDDEPSNSYHNKGSAPPSPELRPAGLRRARSTTPQSGSRISGRYAHLVEDGMTDEEIRRLEEEERALDVAIEQATTGRATPR